MKRVGRTPLPLARDGSTRFLPWLIGLMAYLAVLAVIAALTLAAAIDHWDAGLRGTITVEVAHPPGLDPVPPSRIDLLAGLLRSTPGVAAVTPLDAAAQARLLKPWLGADLDPALLPLPSLIDVRLEAGAAIDLSALETRLAAAVPGTRIETHGETLNRLFRLARVIELAGGIMVGLIAIAAIVTVIFATRTGLALHAAVIDLLHLIGAGDGFIAGQFQRHAFLLGLGGGLVGVILAAASIGTVWLALGGGPEPVPGLPIPPMAISIALLVPLVLGLVALLTARMTVLRALRRRP